MDMVFVVISKFSNGELMADHLPTVVVGEDGGLVQNVRADGQPADLDIQVSMALREDSGDSLLQAGLDFAFDILNRVVGKLPKRRVVQRFVFGQSLRKKVLD